MDERAATPTARDTRLRPCWLVSACRILSRASGFSTLAAEVLRAWGLLPGGELEQVAEELQETEKIHQEAQELGDESLLEEIQGDLARLQVVTPAEPGECGLPWQGMLLRNGSLCRFTQNLCEEVLAPEVCALCCGS